MYPQISHVKLLCIPDTRASQNVKQEGIWAGLHLFLQRLLVGEDHNHQHRQLHMYKRFTLLYSSNSNTFGALLPEFPWTRGGFHCKRHVQLCFSAYLPQCHNNSEGSNTYFVSIEKITTMALDIVLIFLCRGSIDFEGSHDIHVFFFFRKFSNILIKFNHDLSLQPGKTFFRTCATC